jgi:hypothetical protein
LDVEHRIRKIALREDNFIRPVLGQRSAPFAVARNAFGSNGTFFTLFAITGPLSCSQRQNTPSHHSMLGFMRVAVRASGNEACRCALDAEVIL